MKTYSLEQLTEDLQVNPKSVERLFVYHASNGKYGPIAATAAAKDYAQEMAFVRARAAFSRDRKNPAENEILMQTYLHTYSLERSRKNWQNGKRIAAGMAIVELALFVGSLVADIETAKKIVRAGGLAFEAGAGIKFLKDYATYRP